jgi:D-aspartate ligase
VSVPTLRAEKEAVHSILEVGKRLNLKGWVLYPTRDELVAAFSRNHAELADFFRVPTPTWETVKWAWNKWNTYQLAEEIGIPIPRTWCPRNLKDLDQIETDLPVAVKPAVKEDFFYATKAKAWRANDREELRRLFQEASVHTGSNEVLVQEIIPGDGTCQFSSCIFFKNGKSIGSMEAQRWRQHPPEFGRAATYVQSVDRRELEEMSLRFLQAINYYGLAELEYKLDPRDGKLKLLDANIRTWGFHSLGYPAGVDFPYLLFADQLGKPVQTCRGRAGVGWVRMVTDIPASILAIFAGSLKFSKYFQSFAGTITEAVFDSKDPLPSLVEIGLLPYLVYKRGF